MFAEHGFLLFFFVITVSLFVRAWNSGVVSILWGISGIAAGLAVGYLSYEAIIVNLPFPRGAKFAIAFVAGLLCYVVVRQIAKGVFKWLFDAEGPLRFFSDGFGGGLVSLAPSLVTILIMTWCIRLGGTMMELRHLEDVSRVEVNYLSHQYPRTPLSAQWRDGLERVPMVREVFGFLDVYSRVRERNLVGLLIASKKPELFAYLQSDPESRPVAASVRLAELLASPELDELNKKRDHIALLRHPDVRAAALDPGIGPLLDTLELRPLVDGFMLSPARQEVVKGYQRPREDLQ
ncbi:MAG: hypothetical protein KDM91_02900 [Verrucomicrobiae bacterium]|nr:hypothetical protein [Verrucomicrobiae bacterium]MCP5539272.1 hypothetical protein [Akkermansiaceae bacterium]